MKHTLTPVPTIAAATFVGFICSALAVSSRQNAPGDLPGRLGEYVKQRVNLAPDEYKRLLAGEAVTKLRPADASKAVALFGAVWIEAPMSAYIRSQGHRAPRKGSELSRHREHQRSTPIGGLCQALAAA